MNFLKHKLSQDIVWSMGSLGVLAVCGIIINVLIAGLRDATVLGVFNQAYAIYITASQIAVFGLHYSVMRHTALHSGDRTELDRLLINAAFFALLLGICMALTMFSIAPLIGETLESPATTKALAKAAVGLVLFPLNKVLLAFLNGLRHMKAFAILQSLRYIILTLWIGVIAASNYPFERAMFGFLICELFMFIGVIVYLMTQGLVPSLEFDSKWTKLHFSFGAKSLLAGMFVELNSRIDVIMIGLFLPDRSVGIYSFAAMMGDGMYQVLGVLRTTFNPVLVSDLRTGNWIGLQQLLSRAKKYTFPCAIALATGLTIAFWLLGAYIMPMKGLEEGLISLVILLSSLTLVSGLVPFDNLMLVSGRPGLQTLQNLIVVCTNFGLNAALIPLLGIEGAALATAMSYVVGIATIVFLVHRLLAWNLLTNTAWR
ncbi:MAG TPA: oligosaccharide flippase family protein [Bdellovibrionota bacterium]|nr:oligosaccharide flippase family protein [Bdellovibrionota bacterium]